MYISGIVGRADEDCREKWTKELEHKDTTRRGPWTPEEEQALARAVLNELKETAASTVEGMSWTKVAKAVGSRTGIQCRKKWFVSQSTRQHNESSYILQEPRNLSQSCGFRRTDDRGSNMDD